MLIRKLLNWFKPRLHNQARLQEQGESFFHSNDFRERPLERTDISGDIITVCVELLDEGSECWRWTKVLNIGNGFYKFLATSKYDPEDELWAFLPGDIVRLEPVQTSLGFIQKGVRHPNLDVIRIDVGQVKGSPYGIKRTNALGLGGGLYKILPTPTYDPKEESWEFLPGDIVRLKNVKSGGFTYLEPFEKIEDAGN